MTFWERLLKFLDRWFPSNERCLWESWDNIEAVLSAKEVAPELKSAYLLRLSTIASGSGIIASVSFIGAMLAAHSGGAQIAADAYWIFVVFVFGSLFAVVGHVLDHHLAMVMRRIRLGGDEKRGLKSKLIVLLRLLPIAAWLSTILVFAGLFWAVIALYCATASGS